MKTCYFNFGFILVYLIINLGNCDFIDERTNSSMQKLEKILNTIEDLCRLTKELDTKHFLEALRDDCNKNEINKDLHTSIAKETNEESFDKPWNCADLQKKGTKINGVYEVFLNGQPIRVYCDFVTNGGGWTVFQRRSDFGNPEENFERNWNDYKTGFGNVERDFWLGNQNLFLLTNNSTMTLRIELEDHKNNKRYAEYTDFNVEGEQQYFKMTYNTYSGSAGDSLAYHNGRSFVTFDKDNEGNCAKNYRGGWWYHSSHCFYSNLNGFWLNAKNAPKRKCMQWHHWNNDWNTCLKHVEMKIRPSGFNPS